MTPAERIAALEVEAERIKSRLDNLERYLSGQPDAWLDIVARMPADVAEIVIDRALSEARQQALALATVTKTLALLSTEAPAGNVVDPADEIARKRKENIARANAASGQ